MNNATQLHTYLDSDLVLVQSTLTSSKKLLQEMARLLSLPLLKDAEDNVEKQIYQCLLEREKIGNTGIGNGIALPHARFNATQKAIIAIITLEQAIDYDSRDRQPVDIAFGLVVPQEATQEHLSLLAEIARMMSAEGKKEQLVSATSGQQIIDLIESWTN